jgi:tetratricopeptide (TPR) repeat protein
LVQRSGIGTTTDDCEADGQPLAHFCDRSLLIADLFMITTALPFALCLAPYIHPVAVALGEDSDERIRAELAAGRIWEAVSICEGEVETYPRDPDAWGRMGTLLLDLGKEPGSGTGNSSLLFADAASAFDRALELKPSSPALLPLAYDAYLSSGRHSAAIAVSISAIGTSILTEGVASPKWLERVARAERLHFLANQSDEPQAYSDELDSLNTRLENAKLACPEHAPIYLEHALLLKEAGLQRRAAEVLKSGLFQCPDAVELHRELINVHVAGDVPELLSAIYTELAEAAPDVGLVWWYRAWVGIVLGERDRKEMRWGLAETQLLDAARWAGAAAEWSPEHASGSRRLWYRAQLGAAFCALGEGEHTVARTRLMSLLSGSPELRGERDGLGRSLIDGIGILGARYVEMMDYGAGAHLMRLVADQLPGEAQWWNNLAYMSRQHATYVEGSEGVDAAREVFSQSWTAYVRAIALDPENVRYLNDGALIQVYHLRDDLSLAEQMLLRAVELGEAQLASLVESATEDVRYPLALAVGDAYENLGYLHYHLKLDMETALGYFERSLATNSGARPPVAAHLAALHGETEAIEPYILHGPSPETSVRALQVGWEVSFEGARSRAGRERRPIFVYFRGESLTGLDGDFWLHLLRRNGMSQALAQAVPVIADFARHTADDRRVDGTLVQCPNFGAICCGAHIRAAKEFAQFFAEQNDGRAPGADEEGYFLLASDGTGIEFNEALFDQIFADGIEITEPIALGLESPRVGGDAHRKRTEFAVTACGGDEEALSRLFMNPTAVDRAIIESFIFNEAAPRVGRQRLLATLTQIGSDDAHALLSACLHQSTDVELQMLAAEEWTDVADLLLLKRAIEWGRQPVRQAALEQLRDLSTDVKTARYLAVVGDRPSTSIGS